MNCYFSIITVAFNSEKTIEDNIISVRNQKFKNYEHIIIDNLSSDSTKEIIIKNKYKNIIYIRENDLGIYDAMNKGIIKAQGKWIHILNSDDYYSNNDALLIASKKLEKSKLNYFKITFVNKNKSFIKNYSWKYNKFLMNVRANIPHPTMIISKDQYNDIGLFNLKYKIASDHDLTLRLCKKYTPIEHNYFLVKMREGGISRTNPILVAREFRDVTINNGFNFVLAQLIYLYRYIKFKFL